jgi:putative ABC transport system permease protein
VTTGDIDVIKLGPGNMDDIKGVPGVEKVSPMVSTQAQINIDDISSELAVNFADSDFFKLDGTQLSEGEFYGNEEKDKKNIIISSSALLLFNLEKEEAFNKLINFTFFTEDSDDGGDSIIRDFVPYEGSFRIVGIIDEENSNYVFIPFRISQELGKEDYSKIKVKVDKEENLNMVKDAITEKGYLVSALSDIIEQANQIFKIVQIVLASFGIVALIVSAIGMFNTMTIALLERTQEIGIMKALGATAMDIWRMFLAESIIIGFLGGMGGLFIGWFGGVVFNYLINTLAGALGGASIDLFYIPFWFGLLIMTFSTVVGLMTGFYPARRAAKINALEALRYK